MKKTLLSAAFIFAALTGVQAQTFQSDNFESYTIGNIGTDITGETAGQGSWLTYTSGTTGANTDFQIVNEGGAYGKVMQITGSATIDNKFAWKDGIDVAWENRTPGNNVLKVTFDFFTGAPTTSINSYRVVVYGRAVGGEAKSIAGFALNSGTKVVQGLCYLDNAGTINTYLINLATGGLVLNPNTWYSMEIIFNQTTGRVSWNSPDANIAGYYDGAATGFNIDEIDVLVVGGTANTVSTTFKLDNFKSGAVATEEDVLSVKDVELVSKFSVYPNPANDVINVSYADAIDGVTITDLNGRVVKQVVLGVNEAQINIADLSQGVYILNATSNGKSITEKIVKK